MKLKDKIYSFCRINDLEDIYNLLINSFIEYINSYKTKGKWININPELLAKEIGIDKKLIEKLLIDLSKSFPELVKKELRFYCPEKLKENKLEFCDSIIEDNFEKEGVFEADCITCSHIHEFYYDELINYKYDIGFIGEKSKLLFFLY